MKGLLCRLLSTPGNCGHRKHQSSRGLTVALDLAGLATKISSPKSLVQVAERGFPNAYYRQAVCTHNFYVVVDQHLAQQHL